VRNPSGVSWLAPVTIYASGSVDEQPSLLQLKNNTILCAFTTNEGGTYGVKVLFSTDDGVTWPAGGKVTIYDSVGADDVYPWLLLLPNGDILCAFATDEGANFDIKCMRSTDDGATWGSKVTIYASGGFDENHPSLLLLPNGDIICAFETDEGGDDDIKCVRSTDGGLTWGSLTTVFALNGSVEANPALALLPDGTIFCLFHSNFFGAVYAIYSVYSLDGGVTWDPWPIQRCYTASGGGDATNPAYFIERQGRIGIYFATDEDGTFDIKGYAGTMTALWVNPIA
jgi:hypothetical protein